VALRRKDFTQRIQSTGWEKAVKWAIEEIMEEHAQLEKNQIDLANMLNQMTDVMNSFGLVAAAHEGGSWTRMNKEQRQLDPGLERPASDRRDN
jgi:hypothetical protein